jgi:alpha-amylase/alpha-mannosidase (GH57 family)
MSGKLNVCFLWHMHQPYYRDPGSGQYELPWVRLHGIKGYCDMLAAVQQNPGVRVTFNFTPCLVRQISDLTHGNEQDLYYRLSRKPAGDLEEAEQKLILRRFFSANWETMVLRYPRYRDLLHRRGRHVADADIEKARQRFSLEDWRDLQVWFNLAWLGWAAEEEYALIHELKRKGRNFSEEDKTAVLDLHVEILAKIVPGYKAAWSDGRIEIATSPFYHPILPLLIDTSSARISQPQDDLPRGEFTRPGDAREQLIRGRNYMATQLGQAPRGLWPSEGSVSPAVCELADEAGFDWLATDEAILLATMGGGKREEAIYQSYRVYRQGPTIIFRDRFLSDAIGFRYAHNPAKQAVDDFIGHLENIAQARKSPEKSLVAVILDGENAWEYFPDGGQSFFKELYGRLSQHPKLRTTTISDFIAECPSDKVIPPIFPASWIRGSFRIWIGDPVKNAAWERLKEAADVWEQQSQADADKKALQRAQEWLLIAEGSDWFWWFGEPNNSDFDAEFDQLFRFNLIQIYKELGLEIPENLLKPIESEILEEELPLFLMQPCIDGRETTYYEWIGARAIRSGDYSGSMNLSTGFLERLFYGLSQTHLYLRLDPAEPFHSQDNLRIIIRFMGSGQPLLRIQNFRSGETPQAIWCWEKPITEVPDVAFDRILEVAVPFELLPSDREEVYFAVLLKKGDLEIERWPREGSYVCPRPTTDYLTKNWVV